jgi:hypothetical protein
LPLPTSLLVKKGSWCLRSLFTQPKFVQLMFCYYFVKVNFVSALEKTPKWVNGTLRAGLK